MSGSYLDWQAFNLRTDMISGAYYSAREYYEPASIDMDKVWERMYVQPKPVIVICRYCHSHNVISNPTCIQCGAPMGNNSVVKY